MASRARVSFVLALCAAACGGAKSEPVAPVSTAPSASSSAPSSTASTASSATAPSSPIRFNAADMVWGPGPPTLPGVKAALLEGDPRKPGLFTMRLKFPAGFRLNPHTHPADERVTVLSGSVHVGFGDKFDPSKGKAFGAGAYYLTPTPMPHFVWTEEEAVVQVTAMGPWTLSYLDPADAQRSHAP